jgi:predicted RND superfamily exporter protein
VPKSLERTARGFGRFRRTVDALTPWRRSVTPIAAAVVATEATLAVLLAVGVVASAVAAAAMALFLGFASLSL